MIDLRDVSKVYNTNGVPVPALQGVTLQVAEGEFVAVMGPSGSGKSTLLTILGAMNRPTGGQVIIDGIDVYALNPERQADFRHEYIGFVFQQLQLLPYLTALDNVLLALAVSSLPRRERLARAREVLSWVGLAGKEKRLPYQLSGGEQGRVAVARAIVNQPPLLLADEPTGNLDRATGRQVLDLLRRLNRAGQTIVMVTHDPEAAGYAGRVIHLLDGRIVGQEFGVSGERDPARLAIGVVHGAVQQRGS
ncbi:MAG: ABC transporter ATP-binding protein [Chloroflexia bacterium]